MPANVVVGSARDGFRQRLRRRHQLRRVLAAHVVKNAAINAQSRALLKPIPTRQIGVVDNLRTMPKFEFCIPTVGKAVPEGTEWFHEVKYDGYRLRVERDGDRVRLITRGGYDWSKRFPWITEAAMRNRQKRFVIGGEAVILGVDGISDFSALHAGKHNTEVQLCAFDCLGDRR